MVADDTTPTSDEDASAPAAMVEAAPTEAAPAKKSKLDLTTLLMGLSSLAAVGIIGAVGWMYVSGQFSAAPSAGSGGGPLVTAGANEDGEAQSDANVADLEKFLDEVPSSDTDPSNPEATRPEFMGSVDIVLGEMRKKVTDPKLGQRVDELLAEATRDYVAGGVPRPLRWIIKYDDSTKTIYSRQLDFFKIELGVARAATPLTYISKFTETNLGVRKASDDEKEKRFFFAWTDAKRRAWDLEIAKSAKVPADNAVVVHFFSNELEEALAKLEKEYSTQPIEAIRQTRFAIRPKADDEYEFYVLSQVYSTPK